MNFGDSLYQYKIILSYEGTDFYGWQGQPHGNTIQDRCEEVLKEIHY
jgi:tRNA pseudouridine38-40 synthase